MDTFITQLVSNLKTQLRRSPVLSGILAFPLLALALAALPSWTFPEDGKPENSSSMALQPVGSWNNLTNAQRVTLKNGGVVPNFVSGICNGVPQNILLTISSGPAPNAPDNSTINARQPRRWGNSSFYLANQNQGGAGVQYCFDLSSAAGFSMDSREHAYFAKGENIWVSALNGVNPVNLTAAYQAVSGGIMNATITGNGTGNVHFSANGKTGGGLWWTVSSGGQPVTKVCIQYYDVAFSLPSVEPFRLSIDGTKCIADAPVVCNNPSPVSRWGRFSPNDNYWLDNGEPVYDFASGFCDETGDPINFIEIDAEGSAASGNGFFVNNKPPRPYGRHSFDNSREYIGAGGNTYCFTLDEARPFRVNSAEHQFFAGPERVRVRAWLGADMVGLSGFTVAGPQPTSGPNGLTFSGNGYGKGNWWEASSGNQPVSQVCVEYWRTDGGALTGEPFSLELCAQRCLFDDLYACSLNPNGGPCNGIPQLLITKTITPVNEHGLNTCTNASGGIELPVYEISITMYNDAGAVKELFLEEDLLNYFASAYVDTVTAPHIVFSSASGPPLLDPYYDGRNYTNIFLPKTGFLGSGQEITISFQVALNPNAPGALTSYCNTVHGGGTSYGGFVVNDLSGNIGGGYGTPTQLTHLPVGVTGTPAQDVTLEATLMNYMNGPQAWVNNHGGATFNVPGCGPITWTSDFDMDNWVHVCSFVDGYIDVTFTATDACGHVFTTCARFSLVDTQGPGCVKPTNLNLDCSDPNAAADLDEWLNYDGNWNDLSQPVTFTHDFTGLTGNECNGGPVTVTWTAMDNCGNITIFVGYLTVTDSEDPVLVGVPPNATLNPCTVVPGPANVTATDACDPSVLVILEESISGPPCNFTITRTWTATDDCGNVTSATQVITVVDNAAPVFSNVPADITAECPNVPPVQDPTVTDCSAVTVVFTETQIGGACPLANQITRKWTATDACGNMSMVTQVITMTPPVVPSTLIFTFVPPDITVTCDQNPGFGNAIAETTCPAGGLSVSFTDVVNSTGDCSQPFSVTRTWIAHDACGNMATASQTISTGPDTQVPVFASDTPASLTVDCNGPLYTPVAFDNCGATALSYLDSGQTGTCATGFNFTRTWTATDLCGNTSTFVQQVTTNPDNTPPVFIFVPYDQFFDCDEPIVFPDPVAFDNCGDVTITWQDSIIGTGDCHVVNGIEYGYDIIRTWTATDECGNFTTATTSAWVLPGFNSGNMIAFAYVPENKTVGCGDPMAFGTPVCHSACGPLTITFVDVFEENCADGATGTRTWTATDVCGNQTFASQTITVEADHVAPVFMLLPESTTLACGSGDPNFGTPVVTDNCANGTSVTLTHDDVWVSNGLCANQSVTRTWTATDPCGNVTVASQTVNIVDGVAPVFSFVPDNQIVNCGQPVEFGTPEAADACTSLNLTFADETLPGTCEGATLHVRTWTATDACGNLSQASQVIEVKDNVAPVFSFVPGNQTVGCGQPVEFGTPEAADACSVLNLSFADETLPGTCDGSMLHVRTWTATDACGNLSQASQVIEVKDETAPVFSFVPDNQTVSCDQVTTFDMPVAVDGCSSISLSFEDSTLPGSCDGSYTLTRTWTASDACGNSAQVARTLTVVDDVAPVFTMTPEALNIECGDPVAFGQPLLGDDCSAVQLTFEDTTQPTVCGANYTRTWTATDACGNTTQASQTIEMTDNQAPVFGSLPNQLEMTLTEFQTWEPLLGTAEDCSGATVVMDFSSETDCATETWLYNYTATDACGNTSQRLLTVTVTGAEMTAAITAPATVDCGNVYGFAVSTVNGTAPFSFNWQVTGGLGWNIFAGGDQSLASIEAGEGTATVSVVVTDANGCETVVEVPVECNATSTGVSEVGISQFEMLPNPVRDYLTVRYHATTGGDARLRIVNTLGEVMLLRNGQAAAGLNENALDVSPLPSGTYFLSLQLGERTVTEKFVKIW